MPVCLNSGSWRRLNKPELCRYIFGLMGSINLGKRCIMIAMVGETEHDRQSDGKTDTMRWHFGLGSTNLVAFLWIALKNVILWDWLWRVSIALSLCNATLPYIPGQHVYCCPTLYQCADFYIWHIKVTYIHCELETYCHGNFRQIPTLINLDKFSITIIYDHLALLSSWHHHGFQSGFPSRLVPPGVCRMSFDRPNHLQPSLTHPI